VQTEAVFRVQASLKLSRAPQVHGIWHQRRQQQHQAPPQSLEAVSIEHVSKTKALSNYTRAV